MVSVESSDGLVSVILEPNRSATWKQTRLFVLCLGLFVLAVSITWSFVGAWVVLPFAGIEVALLAYFMYRVSKNTYEQEHISIHEQIVVLTTSRQTWQWRRSELKLIIYRAERALDVSRVFLKPIESSVSYDRDEKGVEFGVFLNQTDKELLISALRPHLNFRYLSLRSSTVTV